MKKMAAMEVPDHIYNWMANYFADRGHITRLQDTISLIAIINASIIQGSVIGPPSYVVAASDLHPRSALNCLMKYADDTYLLVGSNNISTLADEFAHINAWARTNNLQLNPSKTRELVVSRRRLRTGSVANLFLQGATRVTSMRVLGVVITGNLTRECHIEELLSSCASSIHALRMLRSHGLGPTQLHEVARMTTLASMLYASPAWWDFTTAHDRDRLERLVRRLRRGGFLPGDAQPIADLASDADERLFRAITTDPSHVLRQLLPKPKHTGYLLRPEQMATSSQRRTNTITYLVCYIKTFTVRNERGALATHWRA